MTADTLFDAPVVPAARVELLRGRAALEPVIAEWERLALESSEPMQSPQWVLAAARYFHAHAPLLTLAIRRDAQLVALMAFVETGRDSGPLEIPGAAALGEPLRPVAVDSPAKAALCDALLDLRRPLVLPRIDDAEFVTRLRAGARGRAWTIIRAGGECLLASLDADPESHLRRCSPARHKVLRRNRRLLEREGPVRFECLTPGVDEADAVLGAAFEVEARSWKGAAGSAVLRRPAMRDFFLDYGKACAVTRKLLVRRLLVGEQVAAVQVAVIENGRCFDLKIGYDEAFARHSPGLTLSCEALADGARRGLRAHEFLGLAEDWQRAFASGERRLESVMLYPLNVAGLAALARDALGALLRRARRTKESI